MAAAHWILAEHLPGAELVHRRWAGFGRQRIMGHNGKVKASSCVLVGQGCHTGNSKEEAPVGLRVDGRLMGREPWARACKLAGECL